MLKRSLALGALMAFVITGQAWAADDSNNNVIVDTAQSVVDVYGGNSVDGSANYNKVTIEGATVTGKVRGGSAYIDASGNEVFVSGSEVTGSVKGGSAQYHEEDYVPGIAEHNKVTITGDSIVHSAVYGAENLGFGIENGSVSENEVKIIGSTVNGDVSGGVVHWAGYSITGKANSIGNKVTIENGVINSFISGGHSSYGDAIQNVVTINGEDTIIEGQIFGGRAQYAEDDEGSVANGNTVIINNGTINGKVFGGAGNGVEGAGNSNATSNEANGNTVEINGGTINKEVYGGNSGLTGVANENIVTVTGGIVTKDIFGGYSKTEANNNIVNISGEASVDGTNVYGGYVQNQDGTSTGNTLNIGDGWSGKIKSAQNFNIVNFGKDSSVTTNVTLGTGATINLANGDDYTGENYAINGKLTTLENDNATLTIGNIKANTYNIASEYAGTKNWVLENDLMQVQKDENGSEIGWNFDGQLQVTVEAKSASVIADNLGVSDSTGSLVAGIVSNASEAEKGSAGEAAANFINNVMNNAPDKGAAINAATKMGEAGGNSATAASIVKNVTGVTNDRLSFNCGHSAPHKGGHGVGLFEEGSGADIWVEYVHGKDEVEDMPSTAGKTSYEGQYNGIVMGVDFKKVNKFQSGIAFNYGEGDTNSLGSSVRTHSDYDFWGVGYYGNIHNDDSNVIFDINYAKTDSDVTQYNSGSTLEASPETTTWSAGVKLEKLYQNENVQIVPYTGLRYMSIDADDYSTKKGEFYYSMDRQDIWLLPVGVSIRQEVANDNGWTVSPRVDLSYIWAFGDTNSNMEVKSPFPGVSQIGYDVMDDGSFLGLVGIEAHKGQWGYGVAYSYQKGDHSESKKWYVDVNYSF